jgi:ribosome-binding factor A
MPDNLRLARVFISVFDRQTTKETLGILNKASSFIRKEVGRNLRLRVMPRIEFFHDKAVDYGMKMDNLIDKAFEKETIEPQEK